MFNLTSAKAVDNMKFNICPRRYDVEDKHEVKETKENFENDYVVKSMGAFGRWQAITITVSALGRLMAMWNILSILFLTPATEFVCKRLDDNSTIVIENSTCYDDCLEYEYEKNVFGQTLISDFGLICDRAWMASFTQTVLMFGLMIGVTVFGWISDRFGRGRAVILSATVDVIFMFGSVFAPNYWTFTVLRFVVGLASGGIMSITSVFTLEIVGPQHRELAGTLVLLPDAIAEATLAGFAYLASTWKVYLLEFGSISLGLLMLLFFLPETPRWLMANGKAEQAVELMSKAAKFNKRSTTSIKENVEKALEELKLKENEPPKVNYLDLFKTKQLSIITISSCTAWFVTGLCYFGINQYLTALGSNVFIVVAVTGVIQMPMTLLTTVITKVYGRKVSAMGSMVVVGVAMMIQVFLPKGSLISTIFGIVAVLSCFVNFCVSYLYVVELYPTPIRNMGFSLSSSSSKLGAMVAPFLANLQPLWVGTLTFAVLPFIATASYLLLPETKGRKLRDTVDE